MMGRFRKMCVPNFWDNWDDHGNSNLPKLRDHVNCWVPNSRDRCSPTLKTVEVRKHKASVKTTCRCNMELAKAVLCSFCAMEKPLPHSTHYKAFTSNQAASILSAVEEDDPRVCSVPPVKPKWGDVFLYSTHGNTAIRGIVCKLSCLLVVVLHHPAHSYNYTEFKSNCT